MNQYECYNDLDIIEKKYITAIEYWCKKNKIKIYYHEMEEEDFSLTGYVSMEDRCIHVKKSIKNHPNIFSEASLDEMSHYLCVMTLVDLVARVILNEDKNKEFEYGERNEKIFEFETLARRYLFNVFSLDEIFNNENYKKFNMKKIFEFVVWLKNIVNNPTKKINFNKKYMPKEYKILEKEENNIYIKAIEDIYNLKVVSRKNVLKIFKKYGFDFDK